MSLSTYVRRMCKHLRSDFVSTLDCHYSGCSNRFLQRQERFLEVCSGRSRGASPQESWLAPVSRQLAFRAQALSLTSLSGTGCLEALSVFRSFRRSVLLHSVAYCWLQGVNGEVRQAGVREGLPARETGFSGGSFERLTSRHGR